MEIDEKDISLNRAMYIIHHVFLPPKLPGAEDYDPAHEMAIVEMLSNALSRFKSFVTDDQVDIIDSVASMMDKVKHVHDTYGHIDELKLEMALQELCEQGGSFPVHELAQNAGLLFGKTGDFVTIEAFELSPTNAAVIQTLGRLRRIFPGRAVRIPLENFASSDFLKAVAYTLAKMSHQTVAHTKPTIQKARQTHDETRDTTHPKIITELFFAFLQPFGQAIDVRCVWKNTREEVMHCGSRLPWHRSPFWLLLRVSMQLLLSRSATQDNVDLYKRLMVFFNAYLLKRIGRKLPSDLIHVMHSKISRRLLKLDLANEEPWLHVVRDTMTETSKMLQNRWKGIIADPRDNLQNAFSSLGEIDFGENVHCKLPELDGFIKSIGARANIHMSTDFNLTSHSYSVNPDELPRILNTPFFSSDIVHSLCAVEMWVATYLNEWLQSRLEHADTCHMLGGLIGSYYKAAFSCYLKNPEATSAMFLTILELWIACDKSALCIYPMLADYDIGLPAALFDSLLLISKGQMERLQSAQTYLASRVDKAIYPSPDIFCNYGGDKSFPVRYFDESKKHQNLRTRIEDEAQEDRKDKIKELAKLKEKYSELMQLHDENSCKYTTTYNKRGRPRTKHITPCSKCRYKKEADDMEIDIHEWPLPSTELKAKATVFELQVPFSFDCWRKITLSVFLDIFHANYTEEKRIMNLYHLRHYGGLEDYFKDSGEIRVGLSSNAKPHINTHYKPKAMSVVTQGDVLLNNGNRYQYYDYNKQSFIGSFDFANELSDLCTYKLPSCSSSLQKYLSRPPPNQVIASQAECPSHFSLEEHNYLASIPLGYRIQWQNILLQLAMPAIDYRKQETALVIFQTIHQAGPALENSVLRDGHFIVGDDTFADTLLNNLEDATERLKGNWESYHGFWVFIALAAKVLSLSSSEAIHLKCLRLLSILREISFGWVTYLRGRVDQSTKNEHKNVLIDKAFRMALICTSSFDCDREYLPKLLQDPVNAKMFFQCAMFIQERANINHHDTNDTILCLLEYRWKRLCCRSAPILREMIVEKNCSSLDDGISNHWPSYRAGHAWMVSGSSEHWLTTRCTDGLTIHFNLLTGELLGNGSPMGHLPNEYKLHETYRALFGDALLEVMPSSEQGMRFAGKTKYLGHTVHLGLENNNLIVRAINERGTFELVPRRTLDGNFPVAYVEKFVHWYNINEGYIVFCLAQAPWVSLSNPWKLTGSRQGWILANDSCSLLSFHSAGNQMICRILSPLEDSLYINCIVQHDSSMLEMDLPSIDLQFSVRRGEQAIYARQYPGMIIDDNQSLGTLVGLRSRLLLTNQHGDRLIIVPEGRLTWNASSKGHITVYVDKRSVVRTHSYSIDDQLCRLVDNGSLQSKLFLCYLHALTSFCVPDALTMRTGTEQALSILSSAAAKSFDRLTKENVDLLYLIARLSPGRKYYPHYLCEMQVVNWDKEISFLSQHGHFMIHVTAIFKHDRKMKMFHEDKYVPSPAIDHAEDALLHRDCMRSANLRVSGFGAEDHTVLKDKAYSCRDRAAFSDFDCRAFKIANFIYQDSTSFEYELPSNPQDYLWNFLREASGTTLNPEQQLDLLELRYDGGLIISPSVSVSKFWCSFYTSLTRKHSELNRFHVMLWLASMAFSAHADMTVLQMLGAFYKLPSELFPEAPPKSTFDLSKGFTVNDEELRRNMQPSVRPIDYCAESSLARESDETYISYENRKITAYENNRDKALNESVKLLNLEWPRESPTIPESHDGVKIEPYLNTGSATKNVGAILYVWSSNLLFRKYLKEVCDILKCQPTANTNMPPFPEIQPEGNILRKPGFVSMGDIFSLPAPMQSQDPTSSLNGIPLLQDVEEVESLHLLDGLIQGMIANCTTEYKKLYLDRLQRSLSSLQGRTAIKWKIGMGETSRERVLAAHLELSREKLHNLYEVMVSSVLGKDTLLIASTVGQYPRVTPSLFLQQLTRPKWRLLNDGWKKCIISYGLALTELQRVKRLFSLARKEDDLIKELHNVGHENWDPQQFPESLLLEVESGIMVRNAQQQIITEIMNLDTGCNKVMQLNMGEGKSSVIVPILASALANPSCLVRVIVAKPQARQMHHVLVSKLGGLLNRRVYHMPFFRGIHPSEDDAKEIGLMVRECMEKGGVLLVQPEQLLSFKLMGIESLIGDKEALGRSLLETQNFFDNSSCDVVDESDENFSTKFELVYAMGTQQSIELSPERWLFIQQLLGFAGELASDIKKSFPHSIEVDGSRPGAFPRVKILKDDARAALVDQIAKHICKVGMFGLAIHRQPEETRQAILRYILNVTLGTTGRLLLLLRGLLAGGVLAFALEKRWRVNYGLHPSRAPPTKLAVPYRGKDSPTARSEFSDPEVVISLTCLSYYYGGLSDDELFLAFNHLSKSDQADSEYQIWVEDAPKLDNQFRQLNGLSLEDRLFCVEHVFPALRYAKRAIDYFLTHIVFPKEMKEFPSKLSASGWDIGEIKTYPTSGFSGTNDSRETLPLSVDQLDLPEQMHTNALVLGYLLQPENSVAIVNSEETNISDIHSILSMVNNTTPPTQVILDVGAQILESNHNVASEWLRMIPESGCQAIIFLDDNDEIVVLDRKGCVEPLHVSPYAKQMEACYVYLDECHTRGTDLRLPKDYRAAVTLGTNLTKDKLVQACMRMRKLGHGQSVVFLIPNEIETKIRSCVSKDNNAIIEVSDVLQWAISETLIDTSHNIALWAVQGLRYQRQSCVWQEHGSRMGMSIDGAKKVLEDDAQTLEQRYSPRARSELPFHVEQNSTNPKIQEILDRCSQFDQSDVANTSLYEEQERELAPEQEREREVERPASYNPAEHMIHEDVRHFATTGELQRASGAFKPAFKALHDTTAANHLDMSTFPHNHLLVTNDFIRTVQSETDSSRFVSDLYQRYVQWILASVDRENTVRYLVIISPFEANELLPTIREAAKTVLHMYSPRVAMAYQPLDHLALYTSPTHSLAPFIPRHLITQLNLFAGQVCISSYREYIDICEFLNLSSKLTPLGWTVRADGFIVKRTGFHVAPAATFQTSPVKFFKILMAQIRRHSDDINKTHMGRMLNGDLLLHGDFLG